MQLMDRKKKVKLNILGLFPNSQNVARFKVGLGDLIMKFALNSDLRLNQNHYLSKVSLMD